MEEEIHVPPDSVHESMFRKQDNANVATKNMNCEMEQLSDLETDAEPLSGDLSMSKVMRDKLPVGLQKRMYGTEKDDAENEDVKKGDKSDRDATAAKKNPGKLTRCFSKNAANFSSGGQNQSETRGEVSMRPEGGLKGARSKGEERGTGEEQSMASHSSVAKVQVSEPDLHVQKNESCTAKAQAKSRNETFAKTVLVAAVTPQKRTQTASEANLPPPHTPTEETAALPKDQPQPSLDPDDKSETEHYDVLLLHSEHDSDHAEQFNQMAARHKWKVISPEDFLPKYTKFQAFNSAFQRSSYTVLLLTNNFMNDVWCEMHYQTALTQSIEDPQRRESVIPVVCENPFQKPMELAVLTSTCPTASKYETIMKRSINVEKRLRREKESGVCKSNIPKPPQKAVARSLDEIYSSRRPELEPSDYAIRVFPDPEVFRRLCTTLDPRLGQDWTKVAEMFGFSSKMIGSLEQEKSPTAQVLNCVCEKLLEEGVLTEEIWEKFRKVFEDMSRKDALDELKSLKVHSQ